MKRSFNTTIVRLKDRFLVFPAGFLTVFQYNYCSIKRHEQQESCHCHIPFQYNYCSIKRESQDLLQDPPGFVSIQLLFD